MNSPETRMNQYTQFICVISSTCWRSEDILRRNKTNKYKNNSLELKNKHIHLQMQMMLHLKYKICFLSYQKYFSSSQKINDGTGNEIQFARKKSVIKKMK